MTVQNRIFFTYLLYAFVGFITTPNVLMSLWKSCVGYHAHPCVARQGVILVLVAGLANCYVDSAGLTIRGSTPGRRTELFCFANHRDRLCGAHSRLFNGKVALFPAGVERPGRGADWHGWICMCTTQYAFVGVFMDAFTSAFTYVCIATFCPECSVSLIPRIAAAHSLSVCLYIEFVPFV